MKSKRNWNYCWYNDFFFIIFILFSARATLLTTNMDPRINPIGYTLTIVSLLLAIIKNKKIVFFDKKFHIAITVFISWNILNVILGSGEFKILSFVNILLVLLIANVAIKIWHIDLFSKFVRTTILLTKIDVILWIIMHFIGLGLFKSIGLFKLGQSTSLSSFLIFNTPNMDVYENIGLFGLMRNCGFCWEPGLFASLISFCITLYIMENKMDFYKRKDFWWLIIGLFSTFSTTGYSATMIILILHFFMVLKKWVAKIFIAIIGGWLCMSLFSLSFMSEKIIEVSNFDNFAIEDTNSLKWIDSQEGTVYTPQRIECMYLSYLNFKENPILGYGTSKEKSFVYKKISKKLAISEGLIEPFAKFGIILGLLIWLMIVKSSFAISRIYQYNLKWILVIAFFIISCSYDFVTVRFFMSFILFDLLKKTNCYIKQKC